MLQSAAAVPEPQRELFLIDGSSFLFRSYFSAQNQDPRYNVRSDDLPTGAVRLFLAKMLQVVERGAAGIMPTHVVVAFDKSRDGWRREIYADYKANREETPQDLKPQIPLMRKAITALGLGYVELDRFEADDIIATYCRLAAAGDYRVTILSADKDLMQLVGPNVCFFDFESGSPGKPGYRPERHYDEAGVRERWEGLNPDQIAHAQALIGDDTDNIPGVAGIGPKTAAELISQFGSVEALLARSFEIRQPKRREAIETNVEQIRTSFRLASLDAAAPVGRAIEEFEVVSFDARAVVAFCKAMEFPAISKRLGKAYDIDLNTVPADPELAVKSAASAGAVVHPVTPSQYQLTGSADRLAAWVAAVRASGELGLFEVAEDGKLLGLGLSAGAGQATYIPMAHEEADSLFGGRYEGQVDFAVVRDALGPLLLDPSIHKVGHDVKLTWKNLAAAGLHSNEFDDVMLISFVLDAGRSGHGIDELSAKRLRHQPKSLDDVTGTGRGRVGLTGLRPQALLVYAAERAEIACRLYREFQPRLSGDLRTVYETLELPLVGVLARMEARGITIDRSRLRALSVEFGAAMDRLDKEIHDLAGCEFDLASPKQIGEVLFGTLGLPGATKTPNGQWATRASILDDLAMDGHRVAQAILEWRGAAKLKSTYTDALQHWAHRSTDRVHTTFGLAATNTARLASYDPNLQNIPIRTEDGRKIRTAFIAAPGKVLISADYSQIELRILAHIADVPALREAFEQGVDIHAKTASEMFGVPIEGMPSEVRRRAKAINFGIIYGISAFGLANQLGIDRGEAADYIRTYFARFPGIQAYMEATKAFCAENGYVETMFGRQIHFPQIRVLNGSDRASVERAAINAPIQGSAADVIRRAMVRVEPTLQGKGLSAQMLLQVHDELIFETFPEEVADTLPVIREVMEGACAPILNLSVPLAVEAKAGGTWEAAH